MSGRPTKAELDEQEREAMDAQIEAELDEWDDMFIAYGHVPSYYLENDDYATYVGPVIANPVRHDHDLEKSSPDDWKAFLKQIEEDLSDD